MSTSRSQRWVLAGLIVLGGVFVWDVLRTHGEMHDRYEAAKPRIEAAMPKDKGIQAVPQEWEVPDDLVISFESHEAGEGLGRRIEIRIEEERRWAVPFPPEDAQEDAVAEWERVHLHPMLSQMVEVVESLVAEREVAVVTLRTPRNRGGLAVPPQVAASVFIVLGEAGVTDIAFDGRPN